jgi:hypothetical protein
MSLHQAYTGSMSYYAPLTSLVQSSGFGKTRICLDMLKVRPGIYMVLRKPLSSGVPAEQYWMRRFFDFVIEYDYSDSLPFSGSKAKYYSPGRFLLALDLIISAYIKRFEELYKEGKNISDILKHLTSLFYKEKKLQTSEIFVDSCFDSLNFSSLDHETISISDLVTNLKTKFTTLDQYIRSNSFPFLLIFDSADYLDELRSRNVANSKIPGLDIVRRGLHLLDCKSRFMAIAVGTKSDIVDFSPSNQDNYFLTYSNRKNILPPLFLPGNFDIFFQDYPIHLLNLDKALLCSDVMFKLLVVMGRPLWSACYIHDVILIAKAKLKNGAEDSIAAAFALLSVRANVKINPHHTLARTLIRSFMLIASYIAMDSTDLVVSYSSEPILALASREILNTNSCLSSFIALRYLSECQAIDIGRPVEYIFELFCLFSVDRACKMESVFTRPRHTFTSENFDTIVPELRPLFTYRINALELRPNVNDPIAGSNLDNSNSNRTTVFEHSSYKVIYLSQFIRYSFGSDVLERTKHLLPENILTGVVNISHFVNLEKIKEDDLKGIPGSSSLIEENDVLIDKSLLKCGLLRQCGFVMPPGYFGIDFIIPFAFEWRSASTNETKTTYSFIAVQSKTSPESNHVCALKMDIKHHLMKCPECFMKNQLSSNCECSSAYTDEEYKEVCANQVSFLLNFNGSEVLQSSQTTQSPANFISKTLKTEFRLLGEILPPLQGNNDPSARERRTQQQLKIFNSACENFKEFIDSHLISDPCTLNSSVYPESYPSFNDVKRSIERPDFILSQSFTHSTDRTFAFESMKWRSGRKSLCFVPCSANIFKELIGPEAFDEVKHLVLSTKSSLDKVSKVQFDLVQYSLHRGRFSSFYATNPLLRQFRNFDSVIETPKESYYAQLKQGIVENGMVIANKLPSDSVLAQASSVKRNTY